jgi:hypothetical protein
MSAFFNPPRILEQVEPNSFIFLRCFSSGLNGFYKLSTASGAHQERFRIDQKRRTTASGVAQDVVRMRSRNTSLLATLSPIRSG